VPVLPPPRAPAAGGGAELDGGGPDGATREGPCDEGGGGADEGADPALGESGRPMDRGAARSGAGCRGVEALGGSTCGTREGSRPVLRLEPAGEPWLA